jgi:hypothetical protein
MRGRGTLNEEGLSRMLADYYRHTCRYMAEVGWMEWTGSIWEMTTTTDAAFRKETANFVRDLTLWAVSADRPEAEVKALVTSRNTGRLNKLTTVLRKYLILDPADADAHHVQILNPGPDQATTRAWTRIEPNRPLPLDSLKTPGVCRRPSNGHGKCRDRTCLSGFEPTTSS